MDAEELIAAQVGYYRTRATQYDDESRHADNDQGRPEYLDRLRGDVAELDVWLDADPPTGHVLEIAAGSGNRTGRLLPAADRVTAVPTRMAPATGLRSPRSARSSEQPSQRCGPAGCVTARSGPW